MTTDFKQREESIRHQAKVHNLEQEVREKELVVRRAKADSMLEKMSEIGSLDAAVDFSTDYDAISAKIKEDIAAREQSISFPYPEFESYIRLSPGSLAAVFASTGSGKSTFVANAAFDVAFRQHKKVLIIVNEETMQDVSARISCLRSGYSIHKFRKGTLAYPQSVLDEIADVSFMKDKIHIKDASKNINHVRSLEGIQKIIDTASKRYDLILIDYYQNIDRSIMQPHLQPFEVQERFANYVDIAKNTAKCPIVIMAQIKKGDDDYEARIKGRKLLADKCTDVYELTVEKSKSRTALSVHKDRWGTNQGEKTNMGYEDGRLVHYSSDFEERMLERQRQMIDAKFNQQSQDDVGDDD